jgi:hypothetical protein
MKSTRSSEEKAILKVVRDAYRYVLKHIRQSSNRVPTHKKDSPKALALSNKIKDMREKPIDHAEFTVPWIQSVAELAEKYQVGNCNEKASAAFFYILKNAPAGTRVEFYSNPFQDHNFVVVNRIQGLDFDVNTWNTTTAICDPWGESYGFIDSFDLTDEDTRPTIFDYILDSKNQYILTKAVKPNANGVTDENVIIINQPLLVLRQSVQVGQNFDPAFRLNGHVPAVYEKWDLAKKDHRLKNIFYHTMFKPDTAPKDKAAISNIVVSYLKPGKST